MRVAFIFIITALVLAGTFSPQYLIWLAPFIAFLSWPEIALFIGASALTWHYFRYWDDLIQLKPLATSLLISRNLVVVTLCVLAIAITVSEFIRASRRK